MIDLQPWGLMRPCDGGDSGVKRIAATTQVGDEGSCTAADWLGRLYKLFFDVCNRSFLKQVMVYSHLARFNLDNFDPSEGICQQGLPAKLAGVRGSILIGPC